MLKIHFLNVGKGSCNVVDPPEGRLSVVDIYDLGTHDDNQLTNPLEHLRDEFDLDNRHIFRFILTHPDMDHMSGLDELDEEAWIENFWDTTHNRNFSEEDWEGSPYRQDDWEQYLEYRESKEDPKCLRLERDQTSECCWSQDNIRILAPSSDLVNLSDEASENDNQKYNHLSYVLMLEHAGVRILLTGDASTEVWEEIHAEYDDSDLQADVFLAPHHGSPDNIHDHVFQRIDPDYVVVSVAEGTDYDYDYYKRLANKELYSTKNKGTIRLNVENDGNYSFKFDRDS